MSGIKNKFNIGQKVYFIASISTRNSLQICEECGHSHECLEDAPTEVICGQVISIAAYQDGASLRYFLDETCRLLREDEIFSTKQEAEEKLKQELENENKKTN